MTRNEWIQRQEAEEEALKNVFENLILFCYETFTDDPTPPTNKAIEQVVAEAVQVYKDAIEDL